MRSLEFIFTTFGLTSLAVIIVYYYSATKEKEGNNFKESRTWLIGGIGYVIMLAYNGLGFNYSDNVFYIFLFISLCVSLYILNSSIRNQEIIPKRFYLGVIIVNCFWMIYSITQGSSYFLIILPSILIQSAAYFFVGLSYLLHEDYEMSMRNVSGMMVLLLTLAKLFYFLKMPIIHSLYVFTVFKVDFVLYLVLCFVIVLFDYNRNSLLSNFEYKKLIDCFKEVPIGIARLNNRGEIISMNDNMQSIILSSESHNNMDSDEVIIIHDLIKLPFSQEWSKILSHIAKGEIYSLDADILSDKENGTYEFLFMPDGNKNRDEHKSAVITCFVLNSKRTYSVVRHVESESGEDIAIPNKYRLMELFEIGIHQKMMRNFGVILIRIVNYDGITNIVNVHETSMIDQLVVSKMAKLDFVYCVGKVNHDTFEIITEELNVLVDIYDYVQYIKDILSHQSLYDNQMNVYTLDYRLGVAMAPTDGMSQRDLLRNASIAIAKATTEEKGYIQFYNEHIKDEVASKLNIESKLRDGIYGEQLFLEYQPQFTIQNEEIRGFEALVRWELQDETIMSPSEFIPLAEELGLMEELGEWVLRNSLKEAVKWNLDYKMNYILSVNISIIQLENEGFADSVIEIVKEFSYPPGLLELEVTETKMAKSSDRVFLELKRLQDAGIKIAIDDFGTGYSSLDYLRLLPFDILKIDKGFIERLHDNDMDHKIVQSIIELVHNMDLESIAEGVETKEQLEFLRNTSCNYIQGYVYSRPLSKDAVIDLINETIEKTR